MHQICISVWLHRFRRISESPFFTCELNRVPTILYPVEVNDTNQSDYDQTQFDLFKEQYMDTHKIVRLDIFIDEHNNGHLLKPVIVCDLVSKRYNPMT
jgi:hypothetical protein